MTKPSEPSGIVWLLWCCDRCGTEDTTIKDDGGPFCVECDSADMRFVGECDDD